MNNIQTSPVPTAEQGGTVSQANMRGFAGFLVGIGLLAAIFYGVLYLQTGAWQILAESGFILLGIATVGFAYSFIRQNKFREASTWLMIGITIAYASPALVWENATAYLLVTGLLAIFAIGITYPPQRLAWALVPLFYTTYIFAANALAPLPRYDINQSPILSVFIPGVTVVIVIWTLWQLVQIVLRYSQAAADSQPLSATGHAQANWFEQMRRAPFWRAVSRLLVEPDETLEDITAKREAQLLATLLLILIPSYIIGRIGLVAAFDLNAFITLVILLGLLISYAYSRTNLFRAGSFLTVIALTASVFTNILPSATPYTDARVAISITWLLLPLLLATVILPIRYLIAYLVLNVLTLVALASLPGFPPGPAASAIAMLVIASLLIVAGRRFRDSVDREGRAEILASQGELVAASQKLQESQKAAQTLSDNLLLVAEISQRLSRAQAVDVILKDAVEIIRSRFGLYYTQVYLTDASQTNLILQSGTGDAGEQLLSRSHRLPLDTSSINGRAAVERKPVVIADTAANAAFLPNPLLPETRSEMAVPLLVGDRVVGVLDMQSESAGSLREEVLPAFEALAGQLAIAIQNATLLADAEQARAEVEKQAARLSRANWADYLDAIYKPEQIGFIYDRDAVKPLAETGGLQMSVADNAVTASIAVAGETLGNLVVEVEEENQSPQAVELVNIVARQVAQQVENLRLLESAERYRFKAEESARRLTREGWEEYFRERAGQTLGYLYDLKEVRPYKTGATTEIETALNVPIKVRDGNIGNLAVLGLDAADADSLSLVNTVSERLAEHLESLRLLEETQQGQLELNRRAEQLAAVSEISTISSRELDIQKMLDTVAQLTRQKFGLYHTRIFTYDANSDTLKAIAFGWQETEQENLKDETIIPLDQEQSLVARAARNRASVVVNDARNEPGWLPNPLLPGTRSELAIPLVIGAEVLGVLDVQADRLDAFSDEDISIQMTLAAQIATALQNARSFTRAQRQADREALLNAISQKIQSATSVEAVLQIAARELGHALGAPRTIAQLSMKDK